MNDDIDEEKASAIQDAGIEKVKMRSVLTCATRRGVCVKYLVNEIQEDHGPVQPLDVHSINVLAIVCDSPTSATIFGQATIDDRRVLLLDPRAGIWPSRAEAATPTAFSCRTAPPQANRCCEEATSVSIGSRSLTVRTAGRNERFSRRRGVLTVGFGLPTELL